MKIWARWPYIHLLWLYFPPECQQDRTFVTQPILLSEKTFLIFDINHQNTRRSDQIETIKNDNANYAPSYHMEGFTKWLRLPFLKKYLIIWKDLDCELFYSELNVTTSQYIYYLATDNIHIVLENDNTVLIKGLKKVVNVKFSRNTHLIETSYDRLKSREITFLAIQGKSC